jgi:CPA2 family monovalent cation:H+ antiporter-2
VPETIEASLQLSEAALLAVGVAAEGASQSVHKKREDLRAALRSAEPKSGSSETSK